MVARVSAGILVSLLALGAPGPGTLDLDFDELDVALVVVRNPLVVPSPIDNLALGDALAEALRRRTALRPALLDPTTTDCARVQCFLQLAKLDEAPARDRLRTILVVSNRRSEDGAEVLLSVLEPRRVFAALEAKASAQDLLATATATVVRLPAARTLAELPLEGTVGALVGGAIVPMGRQARARLSVPAPGTIEVSPHPARALDRGTARLVGLRAGPRLVRVKLEGYEPLEAELALELDGAVELPLVRETPASRQLARAALWGGLAAVTSGLVVFVADGVSGADRALYCVGPDPCTEAQFPLLPLSAALVGAGAALAALGWWLDEE